MFGSNEKKAGNVEAEIQQFVEKYNLEELNLKDLTVVRKIAANLHSGGLLKLGINLSLAKTEERAKLAYADALVDQNWLIINQLSRLNANIEKLANK